MIEEYFFKCRLCFGDMQLGQLSLFSPASHQNSAQTTLLFSHHSYSSQGLLTSLLISLHVLWFRQYVFTVWAKKCWGHHTSWRRTCETRLGLSLWIWALLLCRSAWSWISLRPNNAFSGIYEYKTAFSMKVTWSHEKNNKQLLLKLNALLRILFEMTFIHFFSYIKRCDLIKFYILSLLLNMTKTAQQHLLLWRTLVSKNKPNN